MNPKTLVKAIVAALSAFTLLLSMAGQATATLPMPVGFKELREITKIEAQHSVKARVAEINRVRTRMGYPRLIVNQRNQRVAVNIATLLNWENTTGDRGIPRGFDPSLQCAKSNSVTDPATPYFDSCRLFVLPNDFGQSPRSAVRLLDTKKPDRPLNKQFTHVGIASVWESTVVLWIIMLS